jgi:hypothetical protein
MKKILFTIVTCLFIIGCTEKDELKSNSTITKVFNDTEIEDLTLLMDFFENQICSIENKNRSNVNECYNSFIQRLTKSAETGNLDIKISFNKQKDIYSQINDSTFNEIWHIGWMIEPSKQVDIKDALAPPKDKESFEDVFGNSDTLSWIDLIPNGKYSLFLKEYGNESPVIKKYHQSLIDASTLSPGMVSSIMMNYDYYDIKDVRMKLVFAIHYLTLNDQTRRKEKYQNSNSFYNI